MAQLKRYNGTSWETIGGVVTGDTLPIGTEVDYDGASAPAGWEEVDDPNTYSTSETRIGTWIDGKPLYRKTYNLTTISNSNTDFFDITGLSISRAVKLYGMLYTTAASFPIPLTDSSSNYSVIFLTQTAIRGRAVIGSGSFVSGWITIEYTKTTD